MSTAKPDGNAASIAAARAARRELHEEIQAARDVQRELRAMLAVFDAAAAAAAERAQEALNDTERRVNTEIDELSSHISAENARILEAIARFLACESPAALLDQILAGVVQVIMPVLSEQLINDMPEVLRQCLADIQAEGDKRTARVRASLQVGPRWQEFFMLADNGASGTVTRPPGH